STLGVEVRTNMRIGVDLSWDDLRASADAVFVAIGASEGARLGIPGEDADGVITATEFLVRSNLPPEELPESLRTSLGSPKRVVVVGGGDTSMDCVRSARRLGAEEVTLVYRRTEAEMQGRIEERTHAVEEGVRFEYLASPIEVLHDAEGHVSGLRCVRMELGDADDTGRRRPHPVEGSEFDIAAEIVVTAIGYNVDPEWGVAVPSVTRDRWDRLVVDPE
ncbi:MAG: FAD-dependent oxidoreductase, partial [Xanthomonadales bacterium]|nr:FAD-dependent oxidoreductase [Xanthomonadales bacterium]